ncbi:hypothetical protein [Budvicia diplopodorum]|uniref:hypothetical protein n=1 Tax=Budvicia diplopodorum TaxID=1119056 RepID=UPI00135CEB31|nr:hypothetical protein [Budvicia diplopodorum]
MALPCRHPGESRDPGFHRGDEGKLPMIIKLITISGMLIAPSCPVLRLPLD